jgi:hypothetical protein
MFSSIYYSALMQKHQARKKKSNDSLFISELFIKCCKNQALVFLLPPPLPYQATWDSLELHPASENIKDLCIETEDATCFAPHN